MHKSRLKAFFFQPLGQDLCLNFQECPDSFETIYPEDDTFEYTVSIMKRVRADR